MSPEPPAFSESTKNGDALVLLERLDQRLALADRRLAVQHEAGPAEDAGEELDERLDDLLELGEDQHLLLAAGDGRGDLGEPAELAAVLTRPSDPAAEAVLRVVADLLEAHQCCQHEPAPPHVVAQFLQPLLERRDGRLIQRRLSAAEVAEGLDFRLVG